MLFTDPLVHLSCHAAPGEKAPPYLGLGSPEAYLFATPDTFVGCLAPDQSLQALVSASVPSFFRARAPNTLLEEGCVSSNSSTRSLQFAFLISGIAGLVYEVVWSRYLGLYVGHSAYSQLLVLAVYLGGMAVGSFAIADLSKRLRNPLIWYAGAELLLAAFGIGFHPLFELATGLSYDVFFPAIASAQLVGALRWGISGLIILPQAIVLGATFPLMAAGLVRSDVSHPGRGIARVYLLNTLGGAAGVLISGFWLIAEFGLAGTVVAAALLNLLAAALVWSAARGAEGSDGEQVERAEPSGTSTDEMPEIGWRETLRALRLTLLTVAFGTAAASFAYEIGWIRMLALVLGSATHSFELMLSAFILGLAVGAWLIQGVVDRSRHPVRLLGMVQVLMGLTALISVPLYTMLFGLMAWMVQTLSGASNGYEIFTIGRYGLSLLIMLPSTVLAGMTLPLITGTLLRVGQGEKAIGQVYGINTIGSVIGAGVAGLIALPALGLKGLIVVGALLDVALGLWLLERSLRWTGDHFRLLGAAVGVSALLFAGVGFGTRLDTLTMTSGVYRFGELPEAGQYRSLFYHDGRTATVSAHIGTSDGVIVLATNGKPDASMGPLWRVERRDTLPDEPIPAGRDYTTQVLSPLVALAHRPDARTVANIGHGSGMTATAFLTSEALERIVTIEIEPSMVEGSLVFLPSNGPAFADPRTTYVFDDAKSFFSYRRERFDIIFAEPSNPWVSGTASLFTKEFYERATDFLAEGGVLAQWMQIYELNDALFLSVLAALDQVFPSYRAYLVGDSDVAIVASMDPDMAEPDWSVVASERVTQMTEGAPPFLPEHMGALLLFDERTFRALLDRGTVANSDYRPVLDLGAERARFEQTAADGVYSFAVSPVDLARVLTNETRGPRPYTTVPFRGLQPAMLHGRASWLQEVIAAGGGRAPDEFPEWSTSLFSLETLLLQSNSDVPPPSWPVWASGFDRVTSELHWGTNGWADSTFYGVIYEFLDRTEAPPEARAAVDLRHGLAHLDWARVASASDRLVSRVAAGEPWALVTLLLDASVPAYLRTGRITAARSALNALSPLTGRRPDDLRNQLLEALVAEAEDDGGA